MRMLDAYMMTHDIDWFCCIDGRFPCHFASNGSIIPEFASDRKQLRDFQRYVLGLPNLQNNELRQNINYIRELRGKIDYNEERYLMSFRFFAQKGFYSFDYEWSNDNEGRYRLLIAPGHPLNPEQEISVRYLPQISLDELGERERPMFEDIIRQIMDFV